MTPETVETPTVKINPWQIARQLVWGGIIPVLSANGYTVEPNWRGDLEISRDGVKLASLESNLRLVDPNRATGDVRFVGANYRRRSVGTYKVTDNTINTTNILRRLRDEIIDQQRIAVARAAENAREAADGEILASLPKVAGVKVSVWNGKVEIEANNLTPEMAFTLLKMLEAK